MWYARDLTTCGVVKGVMLNEKNISDQIKEYQSNGLCLIKNLLKKEEIEILQNESLRLWSELKDLSPNNLRVGIRKDQDGEERLERLDPLADISKVFEALNGNERVVGLAEKALGEPVTVLKEKLIYKWSGISGYGAHRDEPYFKVSKNGPTGIEMVSVVIALDRADADNGAILFYPDLRFQQLSSPKEEPRDIDTTALEGKPYIMPKLDPGDIVLFDGIIPHSSSINTSNHSRRTYMITFIPKRYKGCREEYYHHRQQSLTQERKRYYDGSFHVV